MFDFLKKAKGVGVKSPFKGSIVDITEVNDQVFASKTLGDGFAVKPINNIACAPCDGVITQIFPTNHAFGITTTEGLEILVHIGLDTVKLKGKGFKRLVEVGTEVKKGTEIMEVDLDYIRKCKIDTTTLTVITNMNKVEKMKKDLKDNEEILRIKVQK